MHRLKLSAVISFVLVVALLFSVCMLSLGCGGPPAECVCETSVCTCDGKPPPEVVPNTKQMGTHEHECEADEAKLSATHELVIPCNRTCGGSYTCMEECRCVDRSEWDAWQHANAPSTEPRAAGLHEPSTPAKRPAKQKRVAPDLKDPFGEPVADHE